MALKSSLLKEIQEVSAIASNPERAGNNLQRFFELNPGKSLSKLQLVIAAKLFAASQFLANYCIASPDELPPAIKERKNELTKSLLLSKAGQDLLFEDSPDQAKIMKALRVFKKRFLLRISIRDISGESDIQTSMDELTFLSEVIISSALQTSIDINESRFGKPYESEISIIALGKLGGQELNYSSDIDLIAVYSNEVGQTSGVPNPAGITFNKISNHEFYCKVVELFSKLLTTLTEDGIAYRVDLRLRPQGQKGDIALPLKAYQTYYESWGRTWERMVLIRARPVAGDRQLGKDFLEVVRPFVWRETLDYSEIEEIRILKKRIDSALSRDDIKRGHGGIREAEFFVQTFQLLFVGRNSSLKSYRILNAIQSLKWMKIIPEEDLTVLWENYLFLRKVEQYIQMKEDLQTHALPASKSDISAIARLTGFHNTDAFMAELKLKRMQIKNMYNSLLGTEEDIHTEALNLLESNIKDDELIRYLDFRKVQDSNKCLSHLKRIRDHMNEFQTMQERSTTRDIVPVLLEGALGAESPDRALAGLDSFVTSYGIKTAHLTAIRELKELTIGLTKTFSMSPYLTRIFLSHHHYLNMLIEEWSIFKSLKATEEKLEKAISNNEDINMQLARFRRLEEVRLGMLFLQKILTAEDLFRELSYLAEAIVKMIMHRSDGKGISVIAMGKLGGREMTFGSDLDIIFVSENPDTAVAAEKIMKSLTAYTDMGLLYSVDARLRPDGSKGILVKDIEGFRNYYLNSAQNWEIQALLKARPLGGDKELGLAFIKMAKSIILEKGGSIKKEEIKAMRERIVSELAHKSEGIDIKLGPGGIEEIEFFIQYLQLRHAHNVPEVLVQNTPAAIDRLTKKGLMEETESSVLLKAYRYQRKLETFLRLNEADIIAHESELSRVSAKFMGSKTTEDFIENLKAIRKGVLELVAKA